MLSRLHSVVTLTIPDEGVRSAHITHALLFLSPLPREIWGGKERLFVVKNRLCEL